MRRSKDKKDDKKQEQAFAIEFLAQNDERARNFRDNRVY
jgi:hypothetical protein